MGILIFALGLAAAAAIIAELVQRGFRDGDRPGDVRVWVVAIQPAADRRGGWIEVSFDNPGPATALVGLSLARPAWRGRRAPVRGVLSPGTAPLWRVRSSARSAPGELASFFVWSAGDASRQVVRASVGTPAGCAPTCCPGRSPST